MERSVLKKLLIFLLIVCFSFLSVRTETNLSDNLIIINGITYVLIKGNLVLLSEISDEDYDVADPPDIK